MNTPDQTPSIPFLSLRYPGDACGFDEAITRLKRRVGAGEVVAVHRALADLFRRTEEALGLIPDADEARRDRVLDCQTRIIDMACTLPATSLDDAFEKLMLWRIDSDVDPNAATRGERAALSALEDLRRLVQASRI